MDRFQQSREEDRLSALTDDVFLYILARVDLRTAARTSALSTRWRQLPWLLPELSINVKDFLPSPHPDPIEENDMVRAMMPLTEAARSLFARPRRGSTIMKLQLKIYLIGFFSSEIGPLPCDAIDTGLLKDMALAVHDEKKLSERCHPDMLSLAKRTYGFFSAYPSVLHCLTRLSLCNMCFDQLDMHHILFDCCKQLKHLTMANCDGGALGPPWKIDAPNSKLRVLELTLCTFERIKFVCLPELEKLHWDYWGSHAAPMSFGSVPSLKELLLSSSFGLYQNAFRLSDLLYGAAGIHTLTLDFQGQNKPHDTLSLAFLDSLPCRSALLCLAARGEDRHRPAERGGIGNDGAGAHRADGPGAAAGEHGDAGLRVAHALLPARPRVGHQGALQGGHAREGRPRHRRLLRHRRASGVRVRASGREPGAGGAEGAPAVRGPGERARPWCRPGACHRRRRRPGGRLQLPRRRHHQLLRPAGSSGEHGEPGPRLPLRGGRRHGGVPSPHGHQLLGERVPDVRRAAVPAPEPRPRRRQRLRRHLAAHAPDEPLLRGEGGGDRLLRDAAVRGEGRGGDHRRHARLDQRRARRQHQHRHQQVLARGKRGGGGPAAGAGAAVDQGRDGASGAGRPGGGGVRAGGGGRRVPRGRAGAAARLVRRVPRLPRLRARRARLDVPPAAVDRACSADGRRHWTPCARRCPSGRAASPAGSPPDRVPGPGGGSEAAGGAAAQARVR